MNTLSLGGTATSSANAPAASRSTGSSTDTPGSGFEALLNPSTDGTAKTTSAYEPGSKRQDSDARPAADTATAEKPTNAEAGVEKPSSRETDDDSDTPWPPLGLSALIAAPVEPAPAAVPPPSAVSTASGNDIPPALAQPLAQPLTATGTTLAASAEAAPEPLPQIALPLTGGAPRIDDSADAPDPLAFQQILQGVSATETRASIATSSLTASAPPNVQSPEFDEAFGARIGWMAEQKIGHAHIRVTPHDMGQIEVKLQLDGDRVHASFSSAHAEVRSALENSLPRLREMLGEQGLELAQADVGQQQDAPGGEQARAGSGASSTSAGDSGDSSAVEQPAPLLQLRSLLDTYA